MSNEDTSYQIGKYGMLAMLDALGTKGIWKKKDPKRRLENWNRLIDLFENRFKEKLSKKDLKSTFHVFSDTVIITVVGDGKEHGDIEKNLLAILYSLTEFFVIALTYDFLFRGCVSMGNFEIAKNSILGPAIDESAEYHELPQWVGVSLTPSAHKIYEKIAGHLKYSTSLMAYPFAKFDIPLKIGIEKNGWAINWPPSNDFMNDASEKYDETRSVRLNEIIEKELSNTNDIGSVIKLRNTLDYFEELITKNNIVLK